jgi:hypothetical protein
MIVIHPGGERTFLEFEFKSKHGGLTTGVTTEFELGGRFLQGTGKFTGITGRWMERGVSTMTEDTSEWEVEYSVRGR